MNKPTPGKWKRSYEIIEDEEGKTLAICSGHDTSLEQDEANANFVLTAHEACFAVNPSNPLAVAEALPEIVESLRRILAILDALISTDAPMECPEVQTIFKARAALAKLEAKL